MRLFFSALQNIAPYTPAPPLDASTSDVVLVFDGNSLTEGINNAGIDQYYPKLVNTHFEGVFKSKEFSSYGVSGQSTQEMLADVQTQIYPKAVPGKENILIAWEDANSMIKLTNYDNSDKVSGEQNFVDMKTYFQGAKDAGFQHCILLTGYYPRMQEDGFYHMGTRTVLEESLDQMEIYMNLVSNADIKTVPWDYHIDLREAPHIGGVRGQLEDEYFNDYIHLNAIGYDEIAALVIDKIEEIFNII